MIFSRTYLVLFTKGILIGFADIIPGISGSSVALMTGVYTDLIKSIRSIDHKFLMLIVKLKFRIAIKHINGKILIPILIGIPIGIFIMSHLVSVLLSTYSTPLYASLLGLICGTSFLLAKHIQRPNFATIITAMLGALGVMIIQFVMPPNFTVSYLTFVIAGIIAGCFMILPGISGSLILVTMGIYTEIIAAITNMDILLIFCLIIGAILSITTMSRGISSMYRKSPNSFSGLMIGLMLGSTPSLWPWNTSNQLYLSTEIHMTTDVILGIAFIFLGFIIPMLLATRNHTMYTP
ncbi:MAG: DUF368 domain-containing protein [Dehalococcoidia bacterium]